MTSNLGSEQLLEKSERSHTVLTKDVIMTLLEPIVKAHFRPEFINRLDDILPFLPLQKSDMKEIAEIQLKRLAKRLKERQVDLKWSEALLSALAEQGYDPGYGARPLKRLIQNEIVNQLSKGIIEGKIPEKCTVKLDYKNEAYTYTL